MDNYSDKLLKNKHDEFEEASQRESDIEILAESLINVSVCSVERVLKSRYSDIRAEEIINMTIDNFDFTDVFYDIAEKVIDGGEQQ